MLEFGQQPRSEDAEVIWSLLEPDDWNIGYGLTGDWLTRLGCLLNLITYFVRRLITWMRN